MWIGDEVILSEDKLDNRVAPVDKHNFIVSGESVTLVVLTVASKEATTLSRLNNMHSINLRGASLKGHHLGLSLFMKSNKFRFRAQP